MGGHLMGVWCHQKFPGTAAIVDVGDGMWECDICEQTHLELVTKPLEDMEVHLESFHLIKDVTKFLQIRGIKLKLSAEEITKRKQVQAMRNYSIPRGEISFGGSTGNPKNKSPSPQTSWM